MYLWEWVRRDSPLLSQLSRGQWTVDRGITLTSYIYGYEDDGAWEGLSPTGRPRLGRGLDLPWRGPGQPDTYQ